MLRAWLEDNMSAAEVMSVMAVFVGAVLIFLVFRRVIARVVVKHLLNCETCHSDDINRQTRIYHKIGLIFSLISVIVLALYLPDLPGMVARIMILSASSLLIAVIAWLISNLLDLFNMRYSSRENNNHSIKGYVQTGKIVVFLCAILLIMATLADKSPLIILSSLGAAAAIILLLFQHTLLSLVANIQVSSSDAIRIGDWVEIPRIGISGVVTDLALHTTTILNWDNTQSRVPTKYFITEHFTNWQPMFSSGGRRIRQTFLVDQKSVIFVSDNTVHFFRYLSACAGIEDATTLPKQTSNLGWFRRYIKSWLQQRSDIRQDMYLMVRTLSPGPEGLPVEIYCFTSHVTWVEFEEVQSDILEHVLSMARFFHLRIYQKPSGADIAEYDGEMFCTEDEFSSEKNKEQDNVKR